jgi:integrase
MQLRDISIVLIGLHTGLRGCDIVNLKFNNISWSNHYICIIQQKTKKEVIIPLKIEVGNTLSKYIKEGRPTNARNEYIFVKHSAPYCSLGPQICNTALKNILGDNFSSGFHILRRTFASKLLASGTDILDISSLLGHSGTKALQPYLSTDDERMRFCSLSFDDIGCDKVFDYET